MASIFDQVRNTLKNLQGQAKVPQVQSKVNYQPPTSFWNKNNKIATTLLNFQKATPAYQQGGMNNFGVKNFINNNQPIQNYIPQWQAPKMNNPLAQNVANIGAGVVNLPHMAGAMAVTPIANLALDLGSNIGNKIQGKGATPYNKLKSPVSRLEYNALGQKNTQQQVVGNLAGAGLDFLGMTTGGAGKKIAMGAVNNAAKTGIISSFKKGAIQGGAFMGTAGFLQGVSDGKNEKTLLEQFQKGGEEGTRGLIVGAISGGLLNAGGRLHGKIFVRTPKTEQQLRDAAGRYAKGDIPVKPKGMAKAAWDFQLQFNKKYNRNPYTPVYPDEVSKAVKYELEKKGAGLSIRDVTKDENPLGINNTIQPLKPIQPEINKQAGVGSLDQSKQPLLPLNAQGANVMVGEINPTISSQINKLPGVNGTSQLPAQEMGNLTRTSPALVEPATTQIQTPQQLLQDKLKMGNDLVDAQPMASSINIKKVEQTPPPTGSLPPINPSDSSGGSIPQGDPVQKIIQALKEAKPIRGAQEALYSKARAQRVAKLASAGERIPGEQGYYAQLGALKGELPKVQFEGIRDKLTQNDINSVFDTVEKVPFFSPFEKVTAKSGLAKLLGKEGGAVPNKSELTLLSEVFPEDFIKAAMGNRPMMEKIMSGIGQVVAIPRSLMAGGLDMSYGLRQGVFSGYSHPKQFASAFKGQFKNFVSEKAFQDSNNAIKADPMYKLAREAGVALTDLGPGKFKPREEQFQSALAEKIPGIGAMVRASGRAYTGFANKYRFDMFKSLVENAKVTGDFDDPKFLKNAGEFINTITGRGSLGPLERSAGALSTTLFSPRLLASRLQLMNPQFYMKLQPAVRKEALKSLVAYIAGTGTILGAAKLAGANVSTDMTNSDFAKIKVGNTRVDIMGGFQQPIVLLARLLTGKVTSSTTGKTMTLGEGYKPMTRFDIVQRFFESKEAPIISFFSSLAKGEDAIGNKFNLPTEVINRLIPMFVSDITDLYKEGGLSSIPLGIPAFFGAGAQTYGKTELVTGKNQLGEPTSQVRPVPGLGESIVEKIFGQQPLSSSSTTNVKAYYDQLLKMPREQAAAKFDEIAKTNPDLAKKIVKIVKDRQMGVTVEDEVMKSRGVASGDRAISIADEFKKLKTNQEKAALWEHYVKIGVITKDVAKQLVPLLK